jgi:hypothetical protein
VFDLLRDPKTSIRDRVSVTPLGATLLLSLFVECRSRSSDTRNVTLVYPPRTTTEVMSGSDRRGLAMLPISQRTGPRACHLRRRRCRWRVLPNYGVRSVASSPSQSLSQIALDRALNVVSGRPCPSGMPFGVPMVRTATLVRQGVNQGSQTLRRPAFSRSGVVVRT